MKNYIILLAIFFTGMAAIAQEYDITALKSKAEQGDASAQYALCLRYLNGQGVEANDEIALSYLLQAAENDYPEAVYELGCCYNKGALGLPVWKEKAKDFLFHASELGYEIAKTELQELTKDYKLPRKGIRKAVYKQTISVAPKSLSNDFSNYKTKLLEH